MIERQRGQTEREGGGWGRKGGRKQKNVLATMRINAIAEPTATDSR